MERHGDRRAPRRRGRPPAAFVFLETKTSHPLLPLRVVRDRNRGGAFLASLLTGAGLFAMFVFLSYYLQSVLHYSALKAGLAFLPFAFGIILAAGASSGWSRGSGRGSR